MIKGLNTFDLKDKRVLMRVDFNVPIKKGSVADDFRIRAVLPTVQHCLQHGAGIVLMSHLGRPNGSVDTDLSLIPIGETLADLLEMPIKFSDDCVSEDARDTSLGINPGEVHLLENLRFHKEESQNNSQFAMLLAKHGEVFINDAFGTAHRAHSSNVGIVDHFKHKGMGFLMENELNYLKSSFDTPKRPVTIILGGAKIGTKLSLIRRFLNKADTIFISGGMTFTFFKAMGYEVGKSIVDEGMLKIAEKVISESQTKKAKLAFSSDFVCANDMDDEPRGIFHKKHIPRDMMGLDIGPKTIQRIQNIIAMSNTILWNGPAGVFEHEPFVTGTKAISSALVSETLNGKTTIVGGGDTAAAVRMFGHHQDVTHVSTGGGASLELLSGETLPAFSALDS